MMGEIRPLARREARRWAAPALWPFDRRVVFAAESSCAGLVLSYGLVVNAILVTGLTAFAGSLSRTSGRVTGLLLVDVFILVGAAASLSTKTTIFAMTVIILWLFLERDTRLSQDCSSSRLGAA